MMTKRLILSSAALVLLSASLASCSEDSNKEEYSSTPPRFSAMEINVLNRDANGNFTSTNSDEVHVGDWFTVTARQRQRGKLLNACTYTWTNTKGFSQKYRTSVIYDKYEQDFSPVDTLYAESAGTCKLTFTGKYKASGSTQRFASTYGANSSENLEDGTKVSYVVGGIFYFTATAERTITIKP